MAKETTEVKSEVVEETAPYDFFERKHRRGGGHLGALILIFVGIIFLLNNLGILSWNVWNELWKFWPLIIILLGIQILLGKSSFARMFMLLVTLFLLAGVLAYILITYGYLVLPTMR